MSALRRFANHVHFPKERAPRLLFASYMLYVLIQYPISAAFGTTFAFYGLMAPAFFYFAYTQRAQTARIFELPIVKLFFILFGYIIFHALVLTPGHVGVPKTIENTISNSVFLLTTILFFTYADTRLIQRFLSAVAVLAGICACISILLFLMEPHSHDPRLVPIGRADHPIGGALVYGVAGIIALYVANLQTSWKARLFYLAMLACIGIMILLTHSRTPLFAFALCTVLGALLYSKSPARLLALGSAFLFLFALIVSLVPSLQDLLHGYVTSLLERKDSFRFALWQATIEKIQLRPWLGHGMRTTLERVPGAPVAFGPHNIYLATLLHLGIPGALMFLILMLKCLFDALRRAVSKNTIAILPAMLLLHGLISGLTDHGQIVKAPGPLWLILWLSIGIIIANQLKERKEKPAKKSRRRR